MERTATGWAALVVIACVGCPGSSSESSAGGPTPAFVSLYPAELTPPSGTAYPCELTPLPAGLPGIPPADRRYIDRVYTQIVAAIHAKLRLFRELRTADPDAMTAALEVYRNETDAALRGVEHEAVPDGLEAFQEDVLAALRLQQAFFTKATGPLRDAASEALSGDGWDAAWAAMFKVPEGRQASARLQAAWARMQQRYVSWPAETQDSVFHHLCALDLF